MALSILIHSFIHSFPLQHSSHLQILSVAENDFGYDGAVAVSRLIRFNKRLKRLDISRNNIAWEALMLIAKALAINSVLEELRVSFLGWVVVAVLVDDFDDDFDDNTFFL